MIKLTGRYVTGGDVPLQFRDLGQKADLYLSEVSGPIGTILLRSTANGFLDERQVVENVQLRDWLVSNGLDPHTVTEDNGQPWFDPAFLNPMAMG